MGYPDPPKSIGEHIRKRRLESGLTQRQAAELLQVDSFTVLNWEKGHTQPRVIDGKRVIDFLGYDPFPQPTTVAQRLVHERRRRGWSASQAARYLGVDPSTLQRWEQGDLITKRKHRSAVAQLLHIVSDDLPK